MNEHAADAPTAWRPPFNGHAARTPTGTVLGAAMTDPAALGVARLSAGAYLALNAGARREARRGQLVVLGAVVVGYLLGRWR
jgi:hypothetical protein